VTADAVTVIVAQRVSTIMDADQILVIEDESADPAGQHDEVEHRETPGCALVSMLASLPRCVDMHQAGGELP
jgi:ABC-type multidrug transport system fused ATPase/permease subunit